MGVLHTLLFTQQEGKCFYCGEPMDRARESKNENRSTIDHLIPVCRGGSNHSVNYRLAHDRCNNHKDNLTLAEYTAYKNDPEKLRFCQHYIRKMLADIPAGYPKVIRGIDLVADFPREDFRIWKFSQPIDRHVEDWKGDIQHWRGKLRQWREENNKARVTMEKELREILGEVMIQDPTVITTREAFDALRFHPEIEKKFWDRKRGFLDLAQEVTTGKMLKYRIHHLLNHNFSELLTSTQYRNSLTNKIISYLRKVCGDSCSRAQMYVYLEDNPQIVLMVHQDWIKQFYPDKDWVEDFIPDQQSLTPRPDSAIRVE